MTDKKNMQLWDAVKTPNSKYTKKVSMRGGFTAISPQYLIMKATEQFGPYGHGFGLSVSDFDYSLLETYRVAIHNATFFYLKDGERVEFPITNSIEVVTKNGHMDTDYAKKAETNTLSKALSKIGFAADVYMGMFDDNDYVAAVDSMNQLRELEDKEEQAKQAYNGIRDWLSGELKSAETMQNNESYNKVIDRLKGKVEMKCKVGSVVSKGFLDKLESMKREIKQ